ncbi:MAG: hypothetical protein WD295_05870, partial [Bacteroidota bacterium]
MVYIIGESPLVEEYASLCSRRGYAVLGQWNDPKTVAGSKDMKRTSVVPPSTSIALELTNTNREEKRKNLQKLDKALPATAAILSTSVSVTAS